jgi:transcription elongation factor Elf1
MIYFSCPNCQKIAEASDALAGAIVTCPGCQQQMQIPASPRDVPTPNLEVSPIVPVSPDGRVRFRCPHCKKRLRAPTTSVGSVTVCRHCSQRVQVPIPYTAGVPMGLEPPSTPLPGPDEVFGQREPSRYFVARNGRQRGPFNARKLKRLADTGRLQPTDLFWKRGMETWLPASRLRNLFPDDGPNEVLKEPAPSPAATPPATPPVFPQPLAAETPAKPPVTVAPPPTASRAGLPAPLPQAPDVPEVKSTPPSPRKTGPEHVAALVKQGMEHGEKGDHRRAIADLTEALRLDPHNAQAYASRGVIHAQLAHDFARGIADLTRAIQCVPEEIILYEFRALFYRQLGDLPRAAQDDRKVAELRPRASVSSLNFGGVIPIGLGRPSR